MRVLFYAFLIGISIPLSAQEGDSILYWSEDYRLLWSDFRGNSDSSSFQIYEGRFANAISALGLKSPDVDSLYKDCFKVKSVFYRNHSWTTDTTALLLNHERGHFDLQEIATRKLRKLLLSAMNDCHKEEFDVNKLTDMVMDEADSINIKYDEQTNYGTVIMNQELWNKRIKSGLDSLKNYTDEIVICYCD